MDWPTQLDEFESLIKQGRGAAVKKTLMKMSLGAVPRTHYGRLGNIATRAGYPQFTLKLFTREIKKSSFEAADLSVLERAEYAFALTHIGAFPEAQRILERLEPSAYSKVLLYETYALFNQWRYRDAIPQLEKFLELADDRYFHRVGRVNLCAALIFCHEHARALDILRELEREIDSDKQLFLLGNVLELQAQAQLGLRDFAASDRALREAERLLSATGSYFALFAKKWRAVSALMQKRPEAPALLADVRVLARDHRHFETLRECDFFAGIYLNDGDALRKAYFGSPFPSYREKIKSAAGPERLMLERPYELELGGEAAARKITSAAAPPRGSRAHSVLHNLQKLFFSDFYSPLRVGTAFSKLFPGEHYDLQSSPNRVYQLIHRWNEQARADGLPIAIKSEGKGFQVAASAPCTVRVEAALPILRIVDSQLQKLRDHFGQKPFRAAEARRLLGKSQSHVCVLLQRGQEEGLEKSGSGRATVYRFAA